MVTLTADNRTLTSGQRYTYTDRNYSSGVTTMLMANVDGLEADKFVLLGEFGSEGSEVMKIDSVTEATNTVVFTEATRFAHSESTRATVIPYDKVLFYWTATAVFATDTLLGTVDIQADDWHTRYVDTVRSTGFGWFVFHNSEDLTQTGQSNAIPYANFGVDHVNRILKDFFSLLNSNEQKLISYDDAMSWMNEAYSIARNELNLVNNEYSVSGEQTLSAISGTKEYALPSDFSNMISFSDGDSRGIAPIRIEEVDDNDEYGGGAIKYYIRGQYLGLSPTPSEDTTYKYRYQSKITELTSAYDTIDLPDNGSYIIKDYMMFRASEKLMRSNSQSYFELFQIGLNRLKISGHKRDSGVDSWGIADNVRY